MQCKLDLDQEQNHSLSEMRYETNSLALRGNIITSFMQLNCFTNGETWHSAKECNEFDNQEQDEERDYFRVVATTLLAQIDFCLFRQIMGSNITEQ